MTQKRNEKRNEILNNLCARQAYMIPLTSPIWDCAEKAIIKSKRIRAITGLASVVISSNGNKAIHAILDDVED